jgi:acetyl-CoA carboxylase biotin carboxyl carrier protein
MAKHDLAQIDLREGDQRILLRRGAEQGGASTAPPTLAAPAAAPTTPAPAPAAFIPGAAASEPAARRLLEIKSPTPGTFYTAPTPDAEPFVKVGTKVKPETVVCIIEAMKVFNEIPAEVTGTIAAVLVENQQSVEYGQVLFHVDPTG